MKYQTAQRPAGRHVCSHEISDRSEARRVAMFADCNPYEDKNDKFIHTNLWLAVFCGFYKYVGPYGPLAGGVLWFYKYVGPTGLWLAVFCGFCKHGDPTGLKRIRMYVQTFFSEDLTGYHEKTGGGAGL